MKTASCASCAKKASNRQTYTGSYRERKSCARRQDSSTSATSFSVTSSPLSFRRGRHRGLFKPFGFLLVALQFAFFCLLFSRAARGDDNREKHWAVVMDAGSSGTRAHVYTYTLPNETPSVYNERWSGGNRDTSKGASLPVFGEEETLKLRPGLSTYATNPAGSITEIEGLIDFVREHVPEEKRPTTPIILSATAGLRMVKPEQADAIIGAVQGVLRKSEFLFVDRWAQVLPGKKEGAFAWLAANFLGGVLEREIGRASDGSHLRGGGDSVLGGESSLGVLEMGGASMQLTFAIDEKTAAECPDEDAYLFRFKPEATDKEFILYTHSYLGFGQDVAHLEHRKNVASKGSSVDPCLVGGMEYDISVETGAILSDPRLSGGAQTSEGALVQGQGSFETCKEHVEKIFHASKDKCASDQYRCSWDGTYSPPIPAGVTVLATENFFYTLKAFDVHETASSGSLALPGTVSEASSSSSSSSSLLAQEESEMAPSRVIERAGKEFCSQKSSGSDLDEEQRGKYCFSLAYISSMLFDADKMDMHRQYSKEGSEESSSATAMTKSSDSVDLVFANEVHDGDCEWPLGQLLYLLLTGRLDEEVKRTQALVAVDLNGVGDPTNAYKPPTLDVGYQAPTSVPVWQWLFIVGSIALLVFFAFSRNVDATKSLVLSLARKIQWRWAMATRESASSAGLSSVPQHIGAVSSGRNAGNNGFGTTSFGNGANGLVSGRPDLEWGNSSLSDMSVGSGASISSVTGVDAINMDEGMAVEVERRGLLGTTGVGGGHATYRGGGPVSRRVRKRDR